MRPLSRRVGRVVEGTPLLREQAGKTCFEGSNPLLSAIKKKTSQGVAEMGVSVDNPASVFCTHSSAG